MGILDKVKFWKKDVALKDETALPPSGPMGLPEQGYPSPPQQYSYPVQEPRAFQERVSGKDLEMINAKLDAIRAYLESINQRIANLERIAYGETRRY